MHPFLYATQGRSEKKLIMAEAEIKQLRLERRKAKAHFTREVKAVGQLMDRNRSIEEISEAFTQMKIAYEELVKKHDSYTMRVEDDDEFEQEEAWLKKYQETFLNLKMEIKDYENKQDDVIVDAQKQDINSGDKNNVSTGFVRMEKASHARSNVSRLTQLQGNNPTSDFNLEDTCNKSKQTNKNCDPSSTAVPTQFSRSPAHEEMEMEDNNNSGSQFEDRAGTIRQVNETSESELPVNSKQFSMFPVSEENKIADQNVCSNSEVTASTLNRENDMLKPDPHSVTANSQKIPISSNPINVEAENLDEFNNSQHERTAGASSLSSHSGVAPVVKQTNDDIPRNNERKGVGGLEKKSKAVSIKRLLSASTKLQKCCKKKCLQNISENIWKECQNFTRKQKENYVKENVKMHRNKTAKTTDRERNRGFYRKYHFSDGTNVCKTAFCKALGGVCSDFIDKNIDRTQTENTLVSHEAQRKHHQSMTTEAHTQCTDSQNARSNTDTENTGTVNLNIQPEASSVGVNLASCIHVDQSDRSTNSSTGVLILNQNNQKNHKKNIQDETPFNYSANQNSQDSQSVQADNGTSVRPTNSDNKSIMKSVSSSSTESTLNRSTSTPSNNDSMAVEQLLRLSNVSANLNVGKGSKNSETINGQKYQKNDTTTCDQSFTSVCLSNKTGSTQTEEALCSGLAQIAADEETEAPKEMSISKLNNTMNTPSYELEDNQTADDVLSVNGRSNSDNEKQPETNATSNFSSAFINQSISTIQTENVSQAINGSKNIKLSLSVTPCDSVSPFSGLSALSSPDSVCLSAFNGSPATNINMSEPSAPDRQTLFSVPTTNMNRFGCNSSMHTSPIRSNVEIHASNMSYTQNATRSFTSNSPLGFSVVTSQANRMPQHYNMVHNQTIKMPLGLNTVQSQTNRLPLCHNMLQSQTNTLPPRHMHRIPLHEWRYVELRQTSRMPWSHNMRQVHTDRMVCKYLLYIVINLLFTTNTSVFESQTFG